VQFRNFTDDARRKRHNYQRCFCCRSTLPNWGAVSKAGLIALSKTLVQEERVHGIRVTVICPGAVNTELWDTQTVHLTLTALPC